MTTNNGLGKVRAWQVSFAKNASDDVDAHERAVGFAISTMMSNKQERWACSTPEIARRAGVYDDTASKYIQSLKQRGWIGQQRRRHATPLYWLIDKAQETGPEPESYIDKAQETGPEPESYGSRNRSPAVKKPVRSGQESGPTPGERYLEERYLEESVLEPLSSSVPDTGANEMVDPGILTEEIVSFAIRHQLARLSPALLDVLEAAAWELLPGGESNGFANWRGSDGVTYGAILASLREVAPPEECRLLLDAIERHRETAP